MLRRFGIRLILPQSGLYLASGWRSMARIPTVLRTGPYRFFFYAGDGGEPPHIHVERDDGEAKFWLDPVRLERSRGFSRKELNRVRALVEEHQQRLLESWHEFFRG